MPQGPGAYYEYRGIDSSSGGGKDGIWQISKLGELVEVNKADVVEAMRKMEAQ